MLTYELTNEQRVFLGLAPVEDHWDRVALPGDKYRAESVLYYEGDTIKRYIVSTDDRYHEMQYDELTRDRVILLPKTTKGKEKRLSASVLEQRQPMGVYVSVDATGNLTIANYDTQTSFYSTRWERPAFSDKRGIADVVDAFIAQSPDNHLAEIEAFKRLSRKHVKFRSGDYFSFKLNRTEFGFGRVLLDVGKARKQKLLVPFHGLGLMMGQAVIVQLFAFKSPMARVPIAVLDACRVQPADVMMDNLLLYGEFAIIGHRDLVESDFEFPISYGYSLDQRRVVFLQWGLIHKELPAEQFNKYHTGENVFDRNPFGFYGIGFRPHYDTLELAKTIANDGVFDFDRVDHYMAKRDLRNPKHLAVKREIFAAFGLDPDKSYVENCRLSGTIPTTDFVKKLQ